MATRKPKGAAPAVEDEAAAEKQARQEILEIEARAVAAVAGQRKAVQDSIAASDLGAVQTLPEFLDTVGVLSLEDRRRIVDQALVLLDDLYVHLPLKRAMHATDPVQSLKLLRTRLGAISERRFHNEMIDIFVNLRDLHTNYILPEPYRRHTAVLPFLLEEYYDGEEKRRYIVSRLIQGLSHPTFRAGVEVTNWNGVPIDRAVEINADREAGSNEDARHVRGLDRMTIRPMMMSLPPDAEWVTVGYTDPQGDHEIRLDWRVLSPESGAIPDLDAGTEGAAAYSQGLDLLTMATSQAKKVLFAPHAVEHERRVAALTAGGAAAPEALGAEAERSSLLPGNIAFETRDTAHGRFGYIRIWSFNADADQFIQEIIRILGLLPPDGVIIDVRGNGGGIIMSGERLLQLLTHRRIEAERLHFINTPLTERLVRSVPWLAPWKASVERAVRTGAVYSLGFPIEPSETTNALGQQYVGPVVLITDARCYSTTDMFAAGFQDHGIGRILGVDGNTGAGGANVWRHNLLRALLPGDGSPIQPLPNGADMRVAIRRTTRVGPRAGQPVEDLGVVPDDHHPMTHRDVVGNNQDLVDAAAKILAQQTVRRLAVTARRAAPAKARLRLTTRNVEWVGVYAGGRPLANRDVSDGEATMTVDLPARSVNGLEVRGFFGNDQVARVSVSIEG